MNEIKRKILLKLLKHGAGDGWEKQLGRKDYEQECTDQNGRNEVQNERHKATTMEHAMMKNRIL